MAFYEIIRKKEHREDDAELQTCITKTVDLLREKDTSVDRPGILLGEIQGGKTKAFIGIIALVFDRGYDVAIVLTKGTKALARQTMVRVKEDFDGFEDEVLIFDILELPGDLTTSELKQKLILVVKKEVNNLKRINTALSKTYKTALKDKTVLIIDDEADFASVSYRVERGTGAIIPGVISSQIDELRQSANSTDYLQVTATPYSLYLQPETGEQIVSPVFLPKRPAFSVQVPIYRQYIGGKYYFEESKNPNSSAYFVYEEVSTNEREILRSSDRRRFKIEEVLTSESVVVLRQAILNFIVGAAIRRIQEEANGRSKQKYAFAVHTERATATHRWQAEVIDAIVTGLIQEARAESELFEKLIAASYEDLVHSVKVADQKLPQFDVVRQHVQQLLSDGEILIQRVNSERQTEQLLDEKGQLKLRVVLNIFIGGQILDRGITIRNLTGFYYGRRPQKFQQDTVLQHARMYGPRSRDDLAVTRFYTTRDIYDALRRIHEFDEALRIAIKRGGSEQAVVFIRTDVTRNVIPCSPNKLLPSRTTTLRPFKRLLPVGFNTFAKSRIQSIVQRIDTRIIELMRMCGDLGFATIDLDDAVALLDFVETTLEFEEGFDSQFSEMKAGLKYMSQNALNGTVRGKVLLLSRTGRNLNRFKDDGKSFSDAPDTPQDEIGIVHQNAIDIPALVMIKQNGNEDLGWRGTPFWWPVVVAPQNIHTVIYVAKEPLEE